MRNKAVFLDRDGVLNKNVYNPSTGEYESPHVEKDLELFPNAIESLKILQENGYFLFVVSNQPSYAKGKTTLENIKAIEEKLRKIFEDGGVFFKKCYYCYHHPDGIVKEYSYKCECRKPEPYFLLQAKKKYDLGMGKSWMIGDRNCDILCGRSAGVRTILISDKNSVNHNNSDFLALNIGDATKIILNNE